jgi:hypothetical protein
MKPPNDFKQMARSSRDLSFVAELGAMIHKQKKYWLIPIIVGLLLLGLLVFLGGTGAAPFIYTLF